MCLWCSIFLAGRQNTNRLDLSVSWHRCISQHSDFQPCNLTNNTTAWQAALHMHRHAKSSSLNGANEHKNVSNLKNSNTERMTCFLHHDKRQTTKADLTLAHKSNLLTNDWLQTDFFQCDSFLFVTETFFPEKKKAFPRTAGVFPFWQIAAGTRQPYRRRWNYAQCLFFLPMKKGKST